MNQSNVTFASTYKNTFGNLFLFLIVALMILPLVTTFNELLTRIIENTFLYQPIQKVVVPYEIMLVRTTLSFFGIETIPGQTIFQIVKNGTPQGIYISWNCVGWQSFIILLLSLKTGLNKGFSVFSRFEVMAIGFLGTFFINLLRINLVVIIFYFFGRLPAIILHDYGTVLITIVWLFFFWWFVYEYVLVEKEVKSR